MRNENTMVPGLLRDFCSEDDQKRLMSMGRRQKVVPESRVEREDRPQNIYFVMSGEISLRTNNLSDLTRISNGRAIELQAFVKNLNHWECGWKVEREAEILAIPWLAVQEALLKKPRHFEYLKRVTVDVELQKLRRDLRVFGYEKRDLIDLVSSLRFGSLHEVCAATETSEFFCVVSEGSIECSININERNYNFLTVEAGDQGLIERGGGGIEINCEAATRGWYLEAADIKRLASRKQFVGYLQRYLKRKDFGAEYLAEKTTTRIEHTIITGSFVTNKAVVQNPVNPLPLPRKDRVPGYLIKYSRPAIAQIEESWSLAATLVRIGEIAGVPIGLYAAKRLLAGLQNVSLIRGFQNACSVLGFDCELISTTQALRAPQVHLPFLIIYELTPVIVWQASTNWIQAEFVGRKGLHRFERLEFEANSDSMSLVWVGTPKTKSLGDPQISLSSYLSVVIHSPRLVLGLISSGVISFLISMTIPMIYQYFFTSVLTSKRWSVAGILIAGYFVSRILFSALEWIETCLSFTLIQNNQVRFVSSFFQKLTRVRFKFFDFLGPTELLSRFEEAAQAGFLVNEVVIKPAAKLFGIFACLLILYFYHRKIALAAILIVPFVFVITAISAQRRKKLNAANEQFKAAERKILIEAFDHPETNRVSNIMVMSRWRWEQNFIQSSKATLFIAIENAFLNAFDFFCQEGSKFIILGVALSLFYRGELTQGQVLACFLLTERLTSPLWSIVKLFYEIPTLSVHLERFDPIYLAKEEKLEAVKSFPQPSGQVSPPPPKIELKSVNYSYGVSDRLILENVNLTIEPGERVGIIGPSGCGKSTLVNLINGLNLPDQSSVVIGNQDTKTANLSSLRKIVSIISQRTDLFHGSILENIAMGSTNPSLAKAAEAAKLSGADQFISKLPNSYGFTIHRGGGGLSEGQTQMLAIARALYAESQVVIFDEATCHMDPITEATIVQNLLGFLKNKSLIFVTQHANLLVKMDRIIVMRDGRIFAVGTHAELIKTCEFYTDMFARQLALK